MQKLHFVVKATYVLVFFLTGDSKGNLINSCDWLKEVTLFSVALADIAAESHAGKKMKKCKGETCRIWGSGSFDHLGFT